MMEVVRRRPVQLRFSLRGLLAIVTLVAVCLGYRANAVRQTEAADRAVRASGAVLCYGYPQSSPDGSTYREPAGRPIWLKVLTGYGQYDGVASVDLSERLTVRQGKLTRLVPPRDDRLLAGLERHLGQFASLREIDLTGARVTSSGLRHIEALTGLEFLRLDRTSVDDGLHLCGV